MATEAPPAPPAPAPTTPPAPAAPTPAAPAAPKAIVSPNQEFMLVPKTGTGMSKSPQMQAAMARMRAATDAEETAKRTPKAHPTAAAAPAPPASPAPKPAPTASPSSPEPSKPLEAPKSQGAPVAAQEKPSVAPTASPEPVEKKLGPWQLVEKYKGLSRKQEAELVEARRKLADSADATVVLTRAEKAEAEAKELREKLAYHEYTAAPEFADKYQKPLAQALSRAEKSMAQITLTDSEGNTRPGTLDDLTYLSRLPLGKAQAEADALFGSLAGTVMGFRNRIVELAEAQEDALADAKKTAVERKTQLDAAVRIAQQETNKLWQEFNQKAATTDPFLQPKEGDDEWNTKLEASEKYVNGSYAANGLDPKLTPEQRAKIVKMHANIRARAIRHPMLVLENERLKAQLAERDKIIAEYKKGEPTAGEGHGTGGGPAATVGGRPMDRAFARMRQQHPELYPDR